MGRGCSKKGYPFLFIAIWNRVVIDFNGFAYFGDTWISSISEHEIWLHNAYPARTICLILTTIRDDTVGMKGGKWSVKNFILGCWQMVPTSIILYNTFYILSTDVSRAVVHCNREPDLTTLFNYPFGQIQFIFSAPPDRHSFIRVHERACDTCLNRNIAET